MAEELTWDLGASVSYAANERLETAIKIIAPEDGKYYIVGAQYTQEPAMISGTFFGLLQVAGGTAAINNPAHLSVWELEEDEVFEFQGRLTLPYTNYTLGLFLYKLEGDTPSLDDDTLIASISTLLIGPIPPIDINQLIKLMIPIVMLGSSF